jgi:hypothetical protein
MLSTKAKMQSSLEKYLQPIVKRDVKKYEEGDLVFVKDSKTPCFLLMLTPELIGKIFTDSGNIMNGMQTCKALHACIPKHLEYFVFKTVESVLTSAVNITDYDLIRKGMSKFKDTPYVAARVGGWQWNATNYTATERRELNSHEFAIFFLISEGIIPNVSEICLHGYMGKNRLEKMLIAQRKKLRTFRLLANNFEDGHFEVMQKQFEHCSSLIELILAYPACAKDEHVPYEGQELYPWAITHMVCAAIRAKNYLDTLIIDGCFLEREHLKMVFETIGTTEKIMAFTFLGNERDGNMIRDLKGCMKNFSILRLECCAWSEEHVLDFTRLLPLAKHLKELRLTIVSTGGPLIDGQMHLVNKCNELNIDLTVAIIFG